MASLEATLKPIGSFDLPVVAALHQECFDGASWDGGALGSLLGTAGTFGVVILVAGEPVGFVLARVAADECEILSLGVRRSWRRRGMGRRLLRAAVDRAASLGGRRICLEVGETNAGARHLYTSEGFEIVGRRAGYYCESDGPATDALIFSRGLP